MKKNNGTNIDDKYDIMEKSMIPFEMNKEDDLGKFEKKYMQKIMKINLKDKFQAKNLLTAIWTLANEQWSDGYEKGQKMVGEEISQN